MSLYRWLCSKNHILLILAVAVLMSLTISYFWTFGVSSKPVKQKDKRQENQRNKTIVYDRLESKLKAVEDELVDLRDKLRRSKKLEGLLSITKGGDYHLTTNLASEYCHYHDCFDYSRCPIFTPFRAFVYDAALMAPVPMTPSGNATIAALKESSYVTLDPDEACIFIVLLWESSDSALEKDTLQQKLHSLPHWNGEGRNHVILSVSTDDKFVRTHLSKVDIGHAMLVQSFYEVHTIRLGFDLVLPSLTSAMVASKEKDLTLHSPARRKYILSFQGAKSRTQDRTYSDLNVEKDILNLLSRETSSNKDDVYIDLDSTTSSCSNRGFDWCLHEPKAERLRLLAQSTFTLIVVSNRALVSSERIQTRLSEALQTGAIPVILGDRVVLPFSEFIHWNKAVIFLPLGRASELYQIIETVGDPDLLSFRRQGAILFDTYLSNPKAILSGVLATIRTRLSIPADAIMESHAEDFFPPGTSRKTKTATKITRKADDHFPTPGQPFPSPRYLRNFTVTYIDRHTTWNNSPGPFFLYPNNVFDPVLPTDAQLSESVSGFHPKEVGAIGEEYHTSLRGNVPEEQFTIAILTYEREELLMETIRNLAGLPFLNKVIVVWNSPKHPSDDLVWPEIHVPVKVLRGIKNSLNNRFLPLDEIETDAVLSIDDDVHLRHDQIILSFRVWRENRDRIVGFPQRFHRWDTKTNEGFLYVIRNTCEYSMVLTGAAFIHKYYYYQYSYHMPQVIRDKVDELMNCEDVAMNFLVSHLSRKPPMKVTALRDFANPNAKTRISEASPHVGVRHECLRYFTKVFGYMPLLYSQYRADSPLYGSDIKDKHKCFKRV